MNMTMRLDKFLCDMGIGSRSEIKKYIKAGRVRVGDGPAKDAGLQISGTDPVFFDGIKIEYEDKTYLMLYKPAGYITATEDPRQKTVMDIIYSGEGFVTSDPENEAGMFRRDLFPVGRLDIDTEGLLLVTNDGDLSHKLLSPKHHVDKVYYAEVDGPLDEAAVKRFAEGMDLGDFTSQPAVLKIVSSGADRSAAEVTITEGKFHQVKRMFSACGTEVTYLKRLSMGSLTLDEGLKPGEFRRLMAEEIRELMGRE